MSAFCGVPLHDASNFRALLDSVDCNVRSVTQSGYQAVSAPDSQLALALSALMTIYIAIFGLRLLLGLSPLRAGDLTMTAIKLGAVLALATSWPTYQQVVFDTLFRGPEQIAASILSAIQPPNSLLRGNPFDGLQIAFDQMQTAAGFLAHISPPMASPFTGGTPFAALALNLSSYLTAFTTLGLILTAKIVLGLLLALGPLFVAFLLFDSTHGIFEGWLRAALGFALMPLFATLALVVQLTLLAPHLSALAQMVASGRPDLPAATAIFILSLVAASVSMAGVIGLFVVAIGFRLSGAARSVERGAPPPNAGTAAPLEVPAFQPRIASVSAAAAALDRRDMRLEAAQAPRRLSVGSGENDTLRRVAIPPVYRRQPHRSASSTRRDR